MKKGISLVALVATIVVLLILVGAVTVTSISVVNSSKLNNYATELLTLQNNIKQEKVRGKLDKVLGNDVVVDISVFPEDVKYQFSMERIVDNKITLKEVDLVMLGASKTSRGVKVTEDDIYAYSKDTGRVYYIKGLLVDKVKYYGLYGPLATKTNIGINEISNNEYINRTIIVDGIEAIKTESNYINNWVGCEIRIPDTYTNIEVTATGGNVENLGLNSGYNIYVVNQGSSAIQKYTVNGKYTIDGINKTFKYNVGNVDTIPPTLLPSSIIQNYLTDKTTGKTTAIIEVKGVVDEESGVKVIKYEKGTVSDPNTYFKSAGRIAENNIIPLEYSTTYTISAEDNSGNISSIVVNIDSSILDKII